MNNRKIAHYLGIKYRNLKRNPNPSSLLFRPPEPPQPEEVITPPPLDTKEVQRETKAVMNEKGEDVFKKIHKKTEQKITRNAIRNKLKTFLNE